MDPNDNDDTGNAETQIDPADAESGGDDARRGDGKGTTAAPGSLMSLKIRRRVSSEQSRAAAAARADPSRPKPEPAPPALGRPLAAETAAPLATAATPLDRISRVTQRALSARAARSAAPAQPVNQPAAPAAARQPTPPRAEVSHVPAVRDPLAPPIDAPDPLAPEFDPAKGASPQKAADIVAYWTRMRGARRYPKSAEIDAAQIAENWPNSIMIRCRPGSRALEPDKHFMAGGGTGPGLSGLRGSGRVNLSPMMLQWLLGLADEVVREGRPMNDVETFPSVNRVVHYRAVALPFSNNDVSVDHVLCHVNPDA